jgi:hypothetical protein
MEKARVRALLLTMLVAFIAWFWSSSLRARENAVALGKRACHSMGLQFLDDTVVLSRIGLGRNEKGHMTWQRVYTFEFTVDGSSRRQGQVALRGINVQAVHLDHPDGPVILQPGQIR